MYTKYGDHQIYTHFNLILGKSKNCSQNQKLYLCIKICICLVIYFCESMLFEKSIVANIKNNSNKMQINVKTGVICYKSVLK